MFALADLSTSVHAYVIFWVWCARETADSTSTEKYGITLVIGQIPPNFNTVNVEPNESGGYSESPIFFVSITFLTASQEAHKEKNESKQTALGGGLSFSASQGEQWYPAHLKILLVSS